MARKKSGQPKSYGERVDYSKYYRGRDYNPTVPEYHEFDESDQSDESKSDESAFARRPKSNTKLIREHFENNWIPYALGLVLFIGLWFVYDSRIWMTKLDTKLEQLNKDVQKNNSQLDQLEDKIEKETDNLNEKIHQQDLKILENRLNGHQNAKDTTYNKH
ncbi:MAG: hypothetical protein RLN79_02370 [Cytophagales bacterium]